MLYKQPGSANWYVRFKFRGRVAQGSAPSKPDDGPAPGARVRDPGRGVVMFLINTGSTQCHGIRCDRCGESHYFDEPASILWACFRFLAPENWSLYVWRNTIGLGLLPDGKKTHYHYCDACGDEPVYDGYERKK